VKFIGTEAELAAEELTKGDGIVATGRIIFETWIEKDGTPGHAYVLLADSFEKDVVSIQKETRV
jgi:single-stranded DNA-binding protein